MILFASNKVLLYISKNRYFLGMTERNTKVSFDGIIKNNRSIGNTNF